MKQQPRKNVSKGKRRKENKNKSEKLVKIALIAAVVVFAFVIYKIFDILVLSNEKYDLSGETYYQYFYGIMEEYSGKMDVVQRNDDIQLVLENGKVIYLDSTPIYYKNVLGKMLFAKPMELVIPDVGNYKLSKFTNIYEENNTMQVKKFNSSKSKTINNGFIFDGNDLYFFLDDTVITIGDTEYELPPLSYVIVNYRTNVEIYNYDKNEYTIELEYTYPETTINDLNINIFRDKLSSFTTYYDTSNKDRSKNLELSAEKINGKIISPNEEFSYNLTVGARTIEAGYKEAKIYSNGQVVDGIGGGICQLSSTLYNAAFFANLDITERYNHQFLTSYVKEGRDATVVYGVKDFKFKNNRNLPIKIETTVNSGVVTCSIYGIKENPEYDVSFNVETVSFAEAPIKYEFDSSLSLGEQKIKQSGSNSMTVNVYKVVKLNGSIVSKTFIYQDIYKSLDKIVVKRAD